LTLFPGDVCFYAVRAECGLPSFKPSTQDDDIDIRTIEFDDDEVEVEDSSASTPYPSTNDTSINYMKPPPQNGTNSTQNQLSSSKRIPLPKKQEAFQGKQNKATESDEMAYTSYMVSSDDPLPPQNSSNGTYPPPNNCTNGFCPPPKNGSNASCPPGWIP
jgi:hypothetical protein